MSTCNEVGMCGGLGHLNVPVRTCSFVTKSFFRCPNKSLCACGHVGTWAHDFSSPAHEFPSFVILAE